MGATECIRTYNGKLSTSKLKQEIENDKRQDEFEDGCSYSGSWGVKSGIVILNKTFSNRDLAYEWLCENNDKWGPIEAVRVEEKLGTTTQNARIDKQNDLIRKLYNDMCVFNSNWNTKFKSRKSKTMTCKSCNTRFEISRVRSTNCPCCNSSLMSASDLKRLDNLKTKHSNAIFKRDEMISKKTGKTNKYWVAGGVCSC